MPFIQDLNLQINTGNNTSTVTVRYTIRFSPNELAADSVFNERVILMGDDGNGVDDFLVNLVSTRAVANNNTIQRTFNRTVNNNLLDEDASVFNGRDEVYARIILTPFTPTTAQVDSNIITANF